MIKLLSRLFIKDADNVSSGKVREAYGTLCGLLGIFLNILLFAGKFIAGTLTASISVTADAFNNLSDAGSSLITLIGFRLSNQKPDPTHPFGHGRIEYLSGLLVSVIIIVMGFELFLSSVDKIVHPEPTEFSILTVVILVCSIAVKLYMSFYNRSIGKKISSAAMEATSTDSLTDSIATTVVLICTLIAHFTALQIDGWCGIAVSLFILYAGIRSVFETVSPLLGSAPEPEFVENIEKTVMAHDRIVGIHDLIVHDYGPGRLMISLHAEVSSKENICEIHDLIDNIEKELSDKNNCAAVIHLDPVDTDDELVSTLKNKVTDRIRTEISDIITVHDFRIVSGPTHTNLIFDVVVPFKFSLTDDELTKRIKQIVHDMNSQYFAVINIDKDYNNRM